MCVRVHVCVVATCVLVCHLLTVFPFSFHVTPHSILGVVSLVYITVVMIVKYFIFLANDSVYECNYKRTIPR